MNFTFCLSRGAVDVLGSKSCPKARTSMQNTDTSRPGTMLDGHHGLLGAGALQQIGRTVAVAGARCRREPTH